MELFANCVIGVAVVSAIIYAATSLLEWLERGGRARNALATGGSTRVAFAGRDVSPSSVSDFAEAVSTLRYSPTFFLTGGIFQTVTADYPRGPAVGLAYCRRDTLRLEEVDFGGSPPYQCCPRVIPAGTVTLDWHAVNNSGPVVLVAPGLTGDSSSEYVKRISHALANAPQQYRPVVYNPRGRGGIGLDTPFLYSAGYTHDFRRAVQHVRAKVGKDTKIFAVGFSMGASYLGKYLGEEGAACELAGACCLAGPVDCPRLMQNLQEGVLGRMLFDPFLTKSLHVVREKFKHVFDGCSHVDMPHLAEAATLFEFDDRVTAPTMGCKGAADYYHQSSAKHVMHNIARPTMFLHAENDPIVPAHCVPFDCLTDNKHIVSLVTANGAHSMDWPSGLSMRPWAAEVVILFLEHQTKSS